MIDYNKRKYWKLMNYLKYESRAFFDDEIKSILDELSSHMLSSTIKISKDTILYRSQLGCNYDDEGIEIPYPPARMFPLEKEASEGRANPKGISYLC